MAERRLKPLTEINITNLVDVTMTILIIFMITAPLIRSGIDVDLPETTHEAPAIREGILITCSIDGKLFIDGDAVRDTDFEKTLIKHWVEGGKKPVLLSADRDIEYGRIIRLIDRIKSSGITELGLIVETERPKK
jgi:biopolymer transport protein ExbD